MNLPGVLRHHTLLHERTFLLAEIEEVAAWDETRSDSGAKIMVH